MANKLTGSLSPNGLSGSLSSKTVSVSIGGTSAVTNKNHSQLTNLDYEHSGHTGFASAAEIEALQEGKQDTIYNVETETSEGQLLPSELDHLFANGLASITFNDEVYRLATRSGNQWIYTCPHEATGGRKILYLDRLTGVYSIEFKNPVGVSLEDHINNTEVHLQSGERTSWNNKDTAFVDDNAETLYFVK